MKNAKYTPSKGDLIWLEFSPQRRQSVLLLSPQEYNKHGLILAVLMTSKAKGYPFEVTINNNKISGVALADAIKSLDWNKRNVKFVGAVLNDSLMEVLKLLSVLFKV